MYEGHGYCGRPSHVSILVLCYPSDLFTVTLTGTLTGTLSLQYRDEHTRGYDN